MSRQLYHHATPAAVARKRISGEIRSQLLTNVVMMFGPVTCLSVSRTEDVKLRFDVLDHRMVRVEPRGGRFSVSSE